jgi:hypothetical protein
MVRIHQGAFRSEPGGAHPIGAWIHTANGA